MPEVEQMLNLLTSDTLLYDIQDLNVSISDKSLSSHILDKDAGPICCEP